jgi:D-arabinose 1-dehydrogenase-like Zn-dependent alcohol dehydrogenase
MRPDLARHYRAPMAKKADLLHKALRTADRQGNPLEVMVGVEGGVVQVPAALLVMNSQVLTGHLTGSARDFEEAMRFAQTNGVRPMVEHMPLSLANEAQAQIHEGKPRSRIVLDPPGDQ